MINGGFLTKNGENAGNYVSLYMRSLGHIINIKGVIGKIGGIQVIFFLIILLAFVLHAIFLGVIAEDAYISFRFAKNLASGNGLVWNVSEPPVEGYTNFLWVMISAAILRAGLNIGLSVQILGILASFGCLLYSYRFCRRLLGVGSYLSLLPCAYLAIAGPFATWATSGMETNIFTFFVLSSTYYIVLYWYSRKVMILCIGFLLAMLATLTRPEGFGIFSILFGIHCLRAVYQKESRDLTKVIFAATIFYLLPFTVYFLWRFGYYGYVFPNTFYAKTGGSISQWYRGAKYLFWFVVHFVCPLVPLTAAIICEWVYRKTAGSSTTFIAAAKDWSNKFYGSVVLICLCLCYSGYIILVGGDYMAMYRFFVPILPFGYILLAYGATILYAETPNSSNRPMLATALIILGLLGTFVHSTPLESRIFVKPTITHGQHRGVLTEQWHSQRLSVIGRFFNEYNKDKGSSLATNAIGAVSFYSNLRIYGFHGLVDPDLAHKRRKDKGKHLAGHPKKDFAHVFAKEPTFFMFTRSLSKKPLAFPRGFSPEITAILEEHYEIVCKWIQDKENDESGYFCFLQRKSYSNHQ
jgi:hypothetical protein